MPCSPVFPTGRKKENIYLYDSVGLNHRLLDSKKKHILTTKGAACCHSFRTTTGPAPRAQASTVTDAPTPKWSVGDCGSWEPALVQSLLSLFSGHLACLSAPHPSKVAWGLAPGVPAA